MDRCCDEPGSLSTHATHRPHKSCTTTSLSPPSRTLTRHSNATTCRPRLSPPPCCPRRRSLHPDSATQCELAGMHYTRMRLSRLGVTCGCASTRAAAGRASRLRAASAGTCASYARAPSHRVRHAGREVPGGRWRAAPHRFRRAAAPPATAARGGAGGTPPADGWGRMAHTRGMHSGGRRGHNARLRSACLQRRALWQGMPRWAALPPSPSPSTASRGRSVAHKLKCVGSAVAAALMATGGERTSSSAAQTPMRCWLSSAQSALSVREFLRGPRVATATSSSSPPATTSPELSICVFSARRSALAARRRRRMSSSSSSSIASRSATCGGVGRGARARVGFGRWRVSHATILGTRLVVHAAMPGVDDARGGYRGLEAYRRREACRRLEGCKGRGTHLRA